VKTLVIIPRIEVAGNVRGIYLYASNLILVMLKKAFQTGSRLKLEQVSSKTKIDENRVPPSALPRWFYQAVTFGPFAQDGDDYRNRNCRVINERDQYSANGGWKLSDASSN
jgi:hypothetical protein